MPSKFVIPVLVMMLALSACGLKDELERRVEEQASQVITDAMNVSGGGYMGQDIPEGFPQGLFPVYGGTDSNVLGGMRTDMEGKLFFNLVVGTGHDPQTVEAHMREDLEARSSEYEEVAGAGLFMGTIEGWRYSIVVSDGAADGFSTLVSYTLEEL